MAFTEKKYDEALTLLENILSRDPDNPDARLLQAKNWLAKHENKKAIDGLEHLSHSYASFRQSSLSSLKPICRITTLRKARRH